MKLIDIIGHRFGKCKVLREATSDAQGHKLYECRCECNRKFVARGVNLRSGRTTCCGCKRQFKGRNMNGVGSTRKREETFTVNRYTPSVDPDSAIWMKVGTR